VDLRRRAAGQLLRSGHFDRGREVLRQVLREFGMRLPTSRAGLMSALLFERARLRVRGLGFRARPETAIPGEQLRRIDLCDAASTGFTGVDWAAAAIFQTKGLRLALRAGEPGRVARMMAFVGLQSTFFGSVSDDIFARAEEIAGRSDRPEAAGFVALARTGFDSVRGHWTAQLESSAQALEQLSTRCTGVYWEIAWARFYRENALFWLGRLAELARSMRQSIADAEARGDLLAELTRRGSGMWVTTSLAAGEPERAAADLRATEARWSHGGFHLQNWYMTQARVVLGAYRRDVDAAREYLDVAWPTLTASALFRHPALRMTATSRHAMCALVMARSRSQAEHCLELARVDAGRLSRERIPCARSLADLVQAAIAVHRGRDAEALLALDRAIEGFDASDMALYAAAARRRKGALLGGDEGAGLIAAADGVIAEQGVRDPARMAEIFAGGFPD
jgi:hypothetical protein